MASLAFHRGLLFILLAALGSSSCSLLPSHRGGYDADEDADEIIRTSRDGIGQEGQEPEVWGAPMQRGQTTLEDRWGKREEVSEEELKEISDGINDESEAEREVEGPRDSASSSESGPQLAPQLAEDEEEKDARNRAAIERTLKSQIPQFQKCYQQELDKGAVKNKDLKIQGMITMAFTLDFEGKILRAGVEEAELPLNLKACLVEALWKVKFPRVEQGRDKREIDVRLPLNFFIEDDEI